MTLAAFSRAPIACTRARPVVTRALFDPVDLVLFDFPTRDAPADSLTPRKNQDNQQHTPNDKKIAPTTRRMAPALQATLQASPSPIHTLDKNKKKKDR